MEQTSPLPTPPMPSKMPIKSAVNSSSPNKSVLIILLVTLLVVLSSLVTYLVVRSQIPTMTPVPTIQPSLGPTPTDETVNWKMYSKDFSDASHPYPVPTVKYPTNWIYTEQSMEGTADKQVTFKDGSGNPAVILYISERNFMDDYQIQKQSLGPLVNKSVNSLVAYQFQNQPHYIDAYYFPQVSGYFSLQLLKENSRSIWNNMLGTIASNSNNAYLCVFSQPDINTLITDFETLQIKRDSKGVLALFTPPISQKDIDQYNNLSYQFPGTNSQRLYGTLSWGGGKVQSFQIIKSPTPNSSGGCTVNVTEQVKGYSNAGSYVGETPAQPINTIFDVIKLNGIWKIDRYYVSGSTGKYSAWGGS